jgi:hypothetical protein
VLSEAKHLHFDKAVISLHQTDEDATKDLAIAERTKRSTDPSQLKRAKARYMAARGAAIAVTEVTVCTYAFAAAAKEFLCAEFMAAEEGMAELVPQIRQKRNFGTWKLFETRGKLAAASRAIRTAERLMGVGKVSRARESRRTFINSIKAEGLAAMAALARAEDDTLSVADDVAEYRCVIDEMQEIRGKMSAIQTLRIYQMDEVNLEKELVLKKKAVKLRSIATVKALEAANRLRDYSVVEAEAHRAVRRMGHLYAPEKHRPERLERAWMEIEAHFQPPLPLPPERQPPEVADGVVITWTKDPVPGERDSETWAATLPHNTHFFLELIKQRTEKQRVEFRQKLETLDFDEVVERAEAPVRKGVNGKGELKVDPELLKEIVKDIDEEKEPGSEAAAQARIVEMINSLEATRITENVRRVSNLAGCKVEGMDQARRLELLMKSATAFAQFLHVRGEGFSIWMGHDTKGEPTDQAKYPADEPGASPLAHLSVDLMKRVIEEVANARRAQLKGNKPLVKRIDDWTTELWRDPDAEVVRPPSPPRKKKPKRRPQKAEKKKKKGKGQKKAVEEEPEPEPEELSEASRKFVDDVFTARQSYGPWPEVLSQTLTEDQYVGDLGAANLAKAQRILSRVDTSFTFLADGHKQVLFFENEDEMHQWIICFEKCAKFLDELRPLKTLVEVTETASVKAEKAAKKGERILEKAQIQFRLERANLMGTVDATAMTVECKMQRARAKSTECASLAARVECSNARRKVAGLDDAIQFLDDLKSGRVDSLREARAGVRGRETTAIAVINSQNPEYCLQKRSYFRALGANEQTSDTSGNLVASEAILASFAESLVAVEGAFRSAEVERQGVKAAKASLAQAHERLRVLDAIGELEAEEREAAISTLYLNLHEEREELEEQITLRMQDLATKHQIAFEQAEKLKGKMLALKVLKQAIHGDTVSDNLGTKRTDYLERVSASGADVVSLGAAISREAKACQGLYEVMGKLDTVWQFQVNVQLDSAGVSRPDLVSESAKQIMRDAVAAEDQHVGGEDMQIAEGAEMLNEMFASAYEMNGGLDFLNVVSHEREYLAGLLQHRGSLQAEEVRPHLELQRVHTGTLRFQVQREFQRIDDILEVMQMRADQLKVVVQQLNVQKKECDRILKLHLDPCKKRGLMHVEDPDEPGTFNEMWCEVNEGQLLLRAEQGQDDPNMLAMDLNGCIITCLYDEPVASAGFEPRNDWEAFWIELTPRPELEEHHAERAEQAILSFAAKSAPPPPPPEEEARPDSQPSKSSSPRPSSRASSKSPSRPSSKSSSKSGKSGKSSKSGKSGKSGKSAKSAKSGKSPRPSSQGSARSAKGADTEAEDPEAEEEEPEEEGPFEPKDVDGTWVFAGVEQSEISPWVECLDYNSRWEAVIPGLQEEAEAAEQALALPTRDAAVAAQKLKAATAAAMERRVVLDAMLAARSEEQDEAEAELAQAKSHERRDAAKQLKRHRAKCKAEFGVKLWEHVIENGDPTEKEHIENARIQSKKDTMKELENFSKDRMTNWRRFAAQSRKFMAVQLGEQIVDTIPCAEAEVDATVRRYADFLITTISREDAALRKCGCQFVLDLALRCQWRAKLSGVVLTMLERLSAPEDNCTFDCATALRNLACDKKCRDIICSDLTGGWIGLLDSVSLIFVRIIH